MGRKNFYQRLKIGRDATQEEISAAFRALALKFHPDKVVGLDPEIQRKALRRMQSVSEAFATLRNPKMRALYDRCLRDGLDFAVESNFAFSPSSQADGRQQAGADTSRARKLVDVLKNSSGMRSVVCSGDDDYFDFILRGRYGRDRCLIHVKSLAAVNEADVQGIINYARQLDDDAGAVLTRACHSYVLFGRLGPGEVGVRQLVQNFNSAMLKKNRHEPVRGLVIYDTNKPAPYVPFGDSLSPPYKQLIV